MWQLRLPKKSSSSTVEEMVISVQGSRTVFYRNVNARYRQPHIGRERRRIRKEIYIGLTMTCLAAVAKLGIAADSYLTNPQRTISRSRVQIPPAAYLNFAKKVIARLSLRTGSSHQANIIFCSLQYIKFMMHNTNPKKGDDGQRQASEYETRHYRTNRKA